MKRLLGLQSAVHNTRPRSHVIGEHHSENGGGANDAIELVARMCREVCNQNVCRRRCFERADHNEAYVERRIYRDRYRDEDRWRYRDYDRPGVRFHLGLD